MKAILTIFYVDKKRKEAKIDCSEMTVSQLKEMVEDFKKMKFVAFTELEIIND